MKKSQVEVQFTLPIDEARLHHKTDADDKAKEAFVLDFGKVTSVLVKLQISLTLRDGIFQN